MENFSEGDLVVLKSGGPTMSVCGDAFDNPGFLICSYYDPKKAKVITGPVAGAALKKADSEDRAYHGFMLAVNLHGLMGTELKTLDHWWGLLQKAAKGEIVGIDPDPNQKVRKPMKEIAKLSFAGGLPLDGPTSNCPRHDNRVEVFDMAAKGYDVADLLEG